MEREGGWDVPAISLFMMTPVSGTIILEPKKRLIVVVKEVAMPEESAVTTWEVPWLCGLAESYCILDTCSSLFKAFESIWVIV